MSTIRREEPSVSEFQSRQKYKSRKIPRDDDYCLQLMSYITMVTAHLSLKLALDQKVQNFLISVNDKKWKSFGDIVVKVAYKDKITTYALKCKQPMSSSFKQVNSIQELKVDMEKEYKCIMQLKDHEITKFIIFTPRGTTHKFSSSILKLPSELVEQYEDITMGPIDDCIILVKPRVRRNEIINVTVDCDNIYHFQLSNGIQTSLQNIFIYTNQKIFPRMINELLKKKFNNYPDIANDFVKYIENWSEGKLGGNYKLNKKCIILKLGEILLEKYIATPKLIYSRYQNFNTWNAVIKKTDLVVVDNVQYVLSKFCEPINSMIEDCFATKIDTISRSINLNNKIDININPTVKSFLFQEVDNIDNDIPLTKLYRVFWKSELTPLLLSTDKTETTNFIVDVITFMKFHGLNKNFLLKTTGPHIPKIKSNVLKIFQSLDDIKDLVDLHKLKITVNNNFALSLQKIGNSDKFFLKWVKPEIFFDMALEKYNLRPNNFGSNNARAELKIILDDETINELKERLYPDKSLTPVSCLDNRNRLRNVHPALF